MELLSQPLLAVLPFMVLLLVASSLWPGALLAQVMLVWVVPTL